MKSSKPYNRKTYITLTSLLILASLLTSCMSTGVREDEIGMLIPIQALAAKGVPVGKITEAGENYVARRYINGTTEVEYEYDSEKDPNNSTIVLFYSEADIYRNENLAIKSFDDAVDAYLLGASFGNNDVEVIEIAEGFTLGDQNYTGVLQSGGVYFGNLVVAQKGKLVYSFLLAGPYINSKNILADLIGPKLEAYGQ
jgi:hypothetical protein